MNLATVVKDLVAILITIAITVLFSANIKQISDLCVWKGNQ